MSDAIGVRFTETMEGYVAPGAEDYRQGAARGKQAGAHLKFVATMHMDDLAAFVREPAHAARMTGTIEGDGIEGKAAIEDGVFNLFERDDDGRRRMGYAFTYTDAEDRVQRFSGYKDVYNDHVIDFWSDTTTLFVTIEGADGTPPERGVFVIRPWKLVPQVLSFRSVNAGLLRGTLAVARFNLFFARNLVDEYAPRWMTRRAKQAGRA